MMVSERVRDEDAAVVAFVRGEIAAGRAWPSSREIRLGALPSRSKKDFCELLTRMVERRQLVRREGRVFSYGVGPLADSVTVIVFRYRAVEAPADA